MIGSLELHHDNTPAHASRLLQIVLVKYQVVQVTQAPYSPDLPPYDFRLFPKLKLPLKGRDFKFDKIEENTTGQMIAIGRTV